MRSASVSACGSRTWRSSVSRPGSSFPSNSHLARKYRIAPLSISDSVLEIATSDPHDLDCERTLAFATGRTVKMALASPTKIAERTDELYRPENLVDKILEGVTGNYDIQAIDEGDSGDADLGLDRASERPIIRLVDHILAEGVTSRASDIHLEPEESALAVRYRIDGVLRQAMTLPRAAGVPLVSRIKIIAGLDIADRRMPQDGRARVAVNGHRIDLRVSTLPASNGEKVVIRILDNRATVLSLDNMGLAPDEAEAIQTLLGSREGIILVTGPTGSGKTTTLYSLLRQVQGRGVNIVTVEDPVEYRLQGVVQVQVNEKAGLTFAAALRSILRQDPDVVLVGEIRDRETATIATQASLTGHLVFSTLHTNDAPSSVTRLVDIGIESYKIAAAMKGVIAQRLMRKLCKTCREPLDEEPPEKLRKWIPQGTQLYRAVGCPACANTGYRGRFAITEVLQVNLETERRIAANESMDRIAEAARDAGMKSLWESGIYHVKLGETALEELVRVLEMPSDQARSSGGSYRSSGAVAAVAAPPAPPPAAPASQPYSSGVRTPARPLHAVLQGDAFSLLDEHRKPGPSTNGEPKVLLVEDEETLRRLLRDVLERSGFAVTEASDGIEALEMIDRSAPDIVVLDLDLPRLDGYGVLRRLRSRRETAALPVLVLTAKGDEDSEVLVFEFGATEFLSKPLRPRALSARLRSLLKRP
jgi:type II secretory ATPase GspE/PulE/Tfp pilus assembly ATPase PilB-like protein